MSKAYFNHWRPISIIAFCCLVLSTNTFAESRLAPNWVVDTETGQRISLSEELQNGHKVVAIFWATWCRYCRDLLPRLDQLRKTHSDKKVTFIAMNIWEDSDPMAYMKANKLGIPVLLNAENIARKYGVVGTPSVYVIGADSALLYSRRTGQSSDEVMEAVKRSLKF